MKLRSVLLWSLCAIPTMALGAPPAPFGPPPTTAERGPLGGPRGGRGPERIDPADWAKAAAFFRDKCKCPNLLKRAEPQDEHGNGIRRFLLMQYRNLDWLDEQQDEELYKNGIEQLQAFDEVLGMTAQLKPPTTVPQETLRAQMQDAVLKLLNARMEERRLRLDRLRNILDEETQRLRQDQAALADPVKRSELLDNRVKELLQHAERPWTLIDKIRRLGRDGPPESPRPPKHGPTTRP